MTLLQIVNARESLQKLVAQDLPIRKAYDLMQLTDLCNKHLMFYGQEIAKFDPEKNLKRLVELQELEISDVPKITIPLSGDLRLSASDVALLLPLIEFEDSAIPE